MKIEHIAIWATDLEKLKVFYEKYFQVRRERSIHFAISLGSKGRKDALTNILRTDGYEIAGQRVTVTVKV